MQLLIASAILGPALVAASWKPAHHTNNPHSTSNWSPAMTNAPNVNNDMLELKRRQLDRGPNTCGYISGEFANSLTCNNAAYVCVTNTINDVHGCCDPASVNQCSIPTSCIPSASVASCTGACLSNDFIIKCNDATYAYCYTWTYSFGIGTSMLEYGCYNAPGASLIALYEATDAPSSSSAGLTSRPSFSSRSSGSRTIDGSSTSSSTGSSTSSSAPATSTAPSGGGSTTNVGAIAGGVVGGVAVLGAAAAGIIFLLLRKKKKAAAAAAPPTGPAVQPSYKPVPPGPGPGEMAYAQPQYPQQPPYDQQYPQQPPTPQPFYDQNGNIVSYYGGAVGSPDPNQQQQYGHQDVKHSYVPTTANELPGQASGASPTQQTVYSPPHSPVPAYSQQMGNIGGQVAPPHNGAAEVDATPVQQYAAPPHHPQGPIYEAPATRD